jgi:hypothetical protein
MGGSTLMFSNIYNNSLNKGALYCYYYGFTLNSCIFNANNADIGMYAYYRRWPFSVWNCVFSGQFPSASWIWWQSGNVEKSITASYGIYFPSFSHCPVVTRANRSQSASRSHPARTSCTLGFTATDSPFRSPGFGVSHHFPDSSAFPVSRRLRSSVLPASDAASSGSAAVVGLVVGLTGALLVVAAMLVALWFARRKPAAAPEPSSSSEFCEDTTCAPDEMTADFATSGLGMESPLFLRLT